MSNNDIVAKTANKLYQERVRNGTQGSSEGDWSNAERKVNDLINRITNMIYETSINDGIPGTYESARAMAENAVNEGKLCLNCEHWHNEKIVNKCPKCHF